MGDHFSSLAPKQQAFVRYYLAGGATADGMGTRLNATRAAEAAGYASAAFTGCQLLKHPKIRASVDEWMAEQDIQTEQILAREWINASTGAGKFAPVFRKYNIADMLEEAERLGIDGCIRKIKVDRRTDNDGVTTESVTLEFYDAHLARKLLGERLGLFSKEGRGLDLSKLPPFLLALVTADGDSVRSAVAELDALKELRDAAD